MYWKRFLHDFGVANFAFLSPGLQTMKFSEAIRKGDALEYKETRDSYRGCAIGTAYRYRTGELLNHRLRSAFHATWQGSRDSLREEVASVFNIPEEIVAQADRMHQNGTPRLDVADWLEKQGY